MFNYRVKDLEKLQKRFDPQVVKKANTAGLNKATAKVRTFISQSVRKRYAVKAAAIKKRVALKRASITNPTTAIRYRGPRVGLINFSAREKRVAIARKPRSGKGQPWGRFRQAVTVRVRREGSRKRVYSKPGFIAVGANGNEHIFYRAGDGSDRNNLQALKTYSIPEMVARAEGAAGTESGYSEFAAREYDVEFDRALRYYLGKQK